MRQLDVGNAEKYYVRALKMKFGDGNYTEGGTKLDNITPCTFPYEYCATNGWVPRAYSGFLYTISLTPSWMLPYA